MSSAYIALATTVSIGNLSSPGDATPAIHVDYQQLRTLRILVQNWRYAFFDHEPDVDPDGDATKAKIRNPQLGVLAEGDLIHRKVRLDHPLCRAALILL